MNSDPRGAVGPARQLSIFDAGARAKAEGQTRVADAAPALSCALAGIIDRMAASGVPFTSDDIYPRLGAGERAALAEHRNAVGMAITRAAQADRIRKTGNAVPSERANARRRLLVEWIGHDPSSSNREE